MTATPPRILITGANGFLGRPLLRALAGRAAIVPATTGGRRADLLDPDDRARLIGAARADTLVHLAWTTAHGRFWTDPANADWETASADLFARFLAAGGRRVIGIGTCAEYDWTTGAERFAEDMPIRPYTPYGAAKARTADRLAALAAGAEWAWGRVFFCFGPGEPSGRLIPSILDAVRRGEPLGIGPGDTVRDFCAVGHVAAALAALALSPVQGPVNLGSGHPVGFAGLARMVNALNDTPHGGPPLIRPDSRPLGAGEPRVLVADATRLRAEVGFDPPDTLAADLAAYARLRAAA